MQMPDRPTQKIFSLAMKGYENIFCRRTSQKHFNQPISG
jgi:hypothetical protein